MAIRKQLPISGVDVILGNYLDGDMVFPILKVMEKPISNLDEQVHCPEMFPVCAVTRAQARQYSDVVDLSNSFLNVTDSDSSPVERKQTPVQITLQPYSMWILLNHCL